MMKWPLLRATCIAATLGLIACAPPPKQVVKVDVCGPWRPILVSPKDVLTDATARAILAHDQTGAKLCGWKPGK